eukprot:g42924.t1
MNTKNKKLEKLGITTRSNQASPGTMVETGTTTGKSIVNLFDHTLQPDDRVLSQGLNFCPTTKTDPTDLAADTAEFIRQLRLRKFFHKPQGVSSEPNETTNEPEQLTVDYSSESVSFLDTRISIKDKHLSTSLYHKPTDHLTMLHFSSFRPKHLKEAIPYGQTLCIDWICSGEEEREEHLKILENTFIRTGHDVQLIDHQFRHATAKYRNNLLRRQIQDMTDRIPFVVRTSPEQRDDVMSFAAFNMVKDISEAIRHSSGRPKSEVVAPIDTNDRGRKRNEVLQIEFREL